jgi:hypothetical protein
MLWWGRTLVGGGEVFLLQPWEKLFHSSLPEMVMYKDLVIGDD